MHHIRHPSVFELILPPFGIVSTKADHLLNAIFKHPLMRPIHEFRLRLTRAALLFSVKEFDGATANDRLWAHLLNCNASSREIDLGILCMSHKTNLVVLGLCSCIGLEVTNDIYIYIISGAFAPWRDISCGCLPK